MRSDPRACSGWTLDGWTSPTCPPLAPGLEALFDEVADDYDQSGVRVLRPDRDRRLVELVAPTAARAGARPRVRPRRRRPRPARRRGRAGRHGHRPRPQSGRMVEHTRALGAVRRRASSCDAARPRPGRWRRTTSLTASLVLFFLPDPPGAAAGRWLDLLAPGGRSGADDVRGAERPLALRSTRCSRPTVPAAPARPADRRPGQPLRDRRALRGAAARRPGRTSVRDARRGPSRSAVERTRAVAGVLAGHRAAGDLERRPARGAAAHLRRGGRADRATPATSTATIELGQQVRYTVARRD